MSTAKDIVQSADWKSEKHAPVIEAPARIKKGEAVNLTVSVGKQIPHPNTTAHHIAWISVYFLPAGEKFAYHLTRAEFNAHGASTQGADTSTVYANPTLTTQFKSDKSGVIMAVSLCNIHGLWEGSYDITVE